MRGSSTGLPSVRTSIRQYRTIECNKDPGTAPYDEIAWRSTNTPEAGLTGVATIGNPVSDVLPAETTLLLVTATALPSILLIVTILAGRYRVGCRHPPPLTGLLGYGVDLVVPGMPPRDIVPLGKSRLLVFDSSHFDVYNPPGFACRGRGQFSSHRDTLERNILRLIVFSPAPFASGRS